ncbi:hypothetical protein QYM36_017251 [Artemia franciscana]|uniref:C2H2-type domain-containing protein n=3 Tax=Artemia franciscana TaxID=6661 RepID=A0AA88HH33_ARTSF|nr:hypothetical protein QYM36_017251 [Artemia franciscana]
MVQLHVEGLLSLSPEVLKATLVANKSKMVCGLCFKTESHVHSVNGTILFNSNECCIELQCQDDDNTTLSDVEFKVEENNVSDNEAVASDDSDDDFPYFVKPNADEPIEFSFQTREIDLSMSAGTSNIDEANHKAVDHISIEEQFSEDLDLKNDLPKKIHVLKKVDLTVDKNDKKNQIYECQKCQESYSNRNVFINHCATHHGIPASRIFDCDICGKTCKGPHLLKLHRSSIHGIEVQPITCELCQHISPTHVHHNYHMKAKHCETPLVCHLCGKSFTIRSSFNRHIRLHNGIKTPKRLCPICGVYISRPDFLRSHIKLHTDGPNAHKCDECDAVFPSFRKLRSHRQHHRFVRVFNCRNNADPLP